VAGSPIDVDNGDRLFSNQDIEMMTKCTIGRIEFTLQFPVWEARLSFKER
tara:strand:+ start:388 stop:537 length:150 start_codon:yes stop_codon:yes gene_type:complete